MLKSQPSEWAEIWHVASALQMIRMGYNAMFGKIGFVAFFLSYRAKNGLFCVFFAWQANSSRWVGTSDTGVGYGIERLPSTLLMTLFDFRSHHPPRRKYPICHFRSQFLTFLDGVKTHFRCEGVGWVLRPQYTKSRFRQSPIRKKVM